MKRERCQTFKFILFILACCIVGGCFAVIYTAAEEELLELYWYDGRLVATLQEDGSVILEKTIYIGRPKIKDKTTYEIVLNKGTIIRIEDE